MQKDFFKVLIYLCAGTSSLAIANILPNSNYNGFYVGIAAGGSFTSGQENTEGGGSHFFSDSNQTFVETSSSSNDLISNALKGAFYLGYGHTWQLFYLGAEIFTAISNYDMRSSAHNGFNQIISPVFQFNSGYSTKVSLNPAEYGIDLRPGILLTPATLLYGRIGTAINRLSLDSTVTGTHDEFPPTFVRETFGGTFQFSTDKARAALRLGAGIEQRINQWLGLHADYIYTDYGKINMNSSTTRAVNSVNDGLEASTIANNSNVKIINNTVLLGLSYYFSGFANDAFATSVVTTNAFNGVYAGVAGGGSFTNGTANIVANTLVDSNSNFQIPYIQTSAISTNALKGALFAGYGHSWEAVYLGGEIFGDLSSYAMKNSGRERFFQLEPPEAPQVQDLSTFSQGEVDLRAGEFGTDLRPGILLSPTTLVYGRLGVVFNRLSLDSSTATSIQFFPGTGFVPETIALKSNFSTAKMREPLRLGAGIEQHVNSNLAVRADFIYTDYGKITIFDSTRTLINSANLGLDTITLVNKESFTVRNDSVMLGLVYYFVTA